MLPLLPEKYILRRPTLDDVGAILEVMQAYELTKLGRIRSSEKEIRQYWEFPGHDPEQDYWVVLSPENRLIAITLVGHLPPGSNLFCGPCVHPDYSDLGIYDYLLALSEERARALISQAPPEARVSLGTWTPEKDLQAHSSLERAGFMHIRSNWLMEIVMDAPPPVPAWPANLELRPYTPDLLRAVFEADDDAFRDHWGHMPGDFEMWQHWMVRRESFDPSLWFLIFDGEEIAGFALCSFDRGEAWVGELGVRRAWRRQGLGLAFLQYAFGEFYRRGQRRVVLNVDSENLTGAIRLYTRAGMHPIRQMNIHEKELRPGVELSTRDIPG